MLTELRATSLPITHRVALCAGSYLSSQLVVGCVFSPIVSPVHPHLVLNHEAAGGLVFNQQFQAFVSQSPDGLGHLIGVLDLHAQVVQYAIPDRVGTYVRSVTHNSFGAVAAKIRFTRSGARTAAGSCRVVNTLRR